MAADIDLVRIAASIFNLIPDTFEFDSDEGTFEFEIPTEYRDLVWGMDFVVKDYQTRPGRLWCSTDTHDKHFVLHYKLPEPQIEIYYISLFIQTGVTNTFGKQKYFQRNS